MLPARMMRLRGFADASPAGAEGETAGAEEAEPAGAEDAEPALAEEAEIALELLVPLAAEGGASCVTRRLELSRSTCITMSVTIALSSSTN